MKQTLVCYFQGYSGKLCGACKDTHGRLKSGECWKCGSSARDITLIVLTGVLLVVAGYLMVRSALAANDIEAKQVCNKGSSPICGTAAKEFHDMEAIQLCDSASSNHDLRQMYGHATTCGMPKKESGSLDSNSKCPVKSYSTEVFKVSTPIGGWVHMKISMIHDNKICFDIWVNECIVTYSHKRRIQTFTQICSRLSHRRYNKKNHWHAKILMIPSFRDRYVALNTLPQNGV